MPPLDPTTAARVTFARESHWSNTEALRCLAEAKEQAEAGADCFMTILAQYRRDVALLGPEAASLGAMLALVERR